MTEAVEIRHLRYFLAVAQTENFTRAAERLQISQPSISQQITQLERLLGTPLFRRVGKRVFLTEAGVAFRTRAEMVLRRLEEACSSVHEVGTLLSGRIDIGVIPALHVPWVPPVIESLARDFPGLTVGVHEAASSAVESEIEAGRLDLGFGLMTRASPNIRYERLASEPFSLIVPAQGKFGKSAGVALRDIQGERLVLLPQSFDMRGAADAVLMQAGVHPRIAFEIDSIDSTLAAVERTGMPTLLPALVLRGRATTQLRAIPIRDRTRRMEFGLLWPAAAVPDPAALEVAKALKGMIKALV
ncbi:MAG TPA: LysR substrate-binding domain-containing protein [Steroidobacteraceae bacterium]|nr:LysR substrate-binding domain-containing protein [Steroidobacteraceae bacterium]